LVLAAVVAVVPEAAAVVAALVKSFQSNLR
jgi:hypothetical protein